MTISIILKRFLSEFSYIFPYSDTRRRISVLNPQDYWQSYAYVLRKENRGFFLKMLKEVETKKESIQSKGEQFKLESLLIALILEQQKMITELLKLKKSSQQ